MLGGQKLKRGDCDGAPSTEHSSFVVVIFWSVFLHIINYFQHIYLRKSLSNIKPSGFPQALEITENLENYKKSSMHGKIMEF